MRRVPDVCVTKEVPDPPDICTFVRVYPAVWRSMWGCGDTMVVVPKSRLFGVGAGLEMVWERVS